MKEGEGTMIFVWVWLGVHGALYVHVSSTISGVWSNEMGLVYGCDLMRWVWSNEMGVVYCYCSTIFP